MVGRNKKSKKSRRRATARKNRNREAQGGGGDQGGDADGHADDGVLFMRAFGKAREIVNVTRIMAGLPTELHDSYGSRGGQDKVSIRQKDLEELCATVDELRPHLHRLCKAKAQPSADKTKAADKAETKSPPPIPTDGAPLSNALVPARRGRVAGANSLYVEASGKAKKVMHYICKLSGLKDPPETPLQVVEIEGENLEELLVSLEKLSGIFKNSPRARSRRGQERREPGWRFRTPYMRGGGREDYCPLHWPRWCSCGDDLEDFLVYLFVRRVFMW